MALDATGVRRPLAERTGTGAVIVLEAGRSCKRPGASVDARGPVLVRGPSRTRRTTPHGTGIIAPMSERGLPTEGAPACPFVAFEDDRDGRSTAPDHRHRCFAEPRPAPRALAHQEAYCLSSAFPVCPTFQDWARREAAAARPVAASRVRSPRGAAREPPGAAPGACPVRPAGRNVPPAPQVEPSATGPPRRRGSATSPAGEPLPEGLSPVQLPQERLPQGRRPGAASRAGSRAAPRIASRARTRTSPDPPHPATPTARR